MANTYTQLYIQFVFAVQNRVSLIMPAWEQELYKYITGIVQNNGHKMIIVNGIADHLHIFIGLNPNQSISKIMQQVKGDSSEWINKKKFVKGHFEWQGGYGAFSYNRSQIDNVYQYIAGQKAHHSKTTFIEEYVDMLKASDIQFDSRYILKEIK